MKQTMRYVIFIALLLILATWAMSKVVSAETTTGVQAEDSRVAPSPDIKKEESPQRLSSDVREDQIATELSKDVEQPMSAPDSESWPAMPDRTPLCGPSKNAINHYACASGYDVY